LKQKSYAKINLTLDITGILENGYHAICSIMHSVNLYDTITITQTTSKKIELTTNLPFLPNDKKNHAFRAAELFFEATGIKNEGILIEIEKQIPVSAGLAGGSSNAGTVLKILNQLFDTGLSIDELCQIGYRIGADVPYCIHGGTMLAEGIGERLSPLAPLPQIPIVLVKPNFGISTPESFRQWDQMPNHVHPNTSKIIKAIEEENIETIGALLCNTLELPTFEIIERNGLDNPIPDIKECMLHFDAYGALMSGSGPTIFGFFPSMDLANCAAEKLKAITNQVFVTTT